MNVRQSEHGSAHVIIIIILLIAVVGLLGVVLWQDLHKPSTTARVQAIPSTSSTTKTTPKAPVPPAPTTLIVKEWGIKIPVGSDFSYALTGTASNNGVTYANIYSAQLKALETSVGCTEEDGTVDGVAREPVGTENASYDIVSPVINGYEYVLNARSQGMCIDNLGDQSAQYQEVNSLYNTLHAELKAAWPSIVAS